VTLLENHQSFLIVDDHLLYEDSQEMIDYLA
jgi:hypothetical protein